MPKPWIVFDDEELTPTQKLVYSCLCKYQGGNESCFPSRKTIALNCGISTSTVQRAVNVLVKKGYIVKTNRRRPDGGKTSNDYKCMK